LSEVDLSFDGLSRTCLVLYVIEDLPDLFSGTSQSALAEGDEILSSLPLS